MYYKKLFKNNALMVLLLIALASICPHAACLACGHMIPQAPQSRTGSREPVRKDEPYQDLVTHGNILKMYALNESASCKAVLQDFQKESLQKVEELKSTQEFQEIVQALQSNPSHIHNTTVNKLNEANLYIFISFSMGEKALLNLAHEAKRFGATLVFRGFLEGSYVKTAQALQKIILKTGQGVIIDPELYTLFNISAVPTFVLARPFQLYAQERTQTPIHDQLQGHVSVKYTLEQFAEKGDLKREAQLLLKQGANP